MAMRTLPRNLKKSTHAHTNKETHKQKHPFQKLLPPVAASSCGALANQGPQEPIEAKEHNRKTNNAKEEKKKKKTANAFRTARSETSSGWPMPHPPPSPRSPERQQASRKDEKELQQQLKASNQPRANNVMHTRNKVA